MSTTASATSRMMNMNRMMKRTILETATTTPTSSSRLHQVLTTPSTVASALDWKKLHHDGTVLTLTIHSNRISAAIASHPALTSTTRALPDIPMGRRATVTDETKERLHEYLKDHRMCGVVVAWPIQTDTGRMGAACGRVLHTLDQLLLDTTAPSLSSSSLLQQRPICLWDAGDHSHTPPPPDEWGRTSAFVGKTTTTTTTTTTTRIHRASLEQYHTDEALTPLQVWDHFCQAHWPELTTLQQQTQTQSAITDRQRTLSSSIIVKNNNNILNNNKKTKTLIKTSGLMDQTWIVPMKEDKPTRTRTHTNTNDNSNSSPWKHNSSALYATTTTTKYEVASL